MTDAKLYKYPDRNIAIKQKKKVAKVQESYYICAVKY